MEIAKLIFFITITLSTILFNGNSFGFDLGGALNSVAKELSKELQKTDKNQNCREVTDVFGDSEMICEPKEKQKGAEEPQQQVQPNKQANGQTYTYDLQTGIDAYTKQDFKTAFTIFLGLAKQGNLDAQNNY